MKPRTAIIAGLTVLLVLFATSSGSLWIDEGDTACYATQQSLTDWSRHLLGDRAADCQFPLYMFLVWAWAKVAGSSEYALRSLNVVFALVAISAFALLGRSLKAPKLWLALLIQPFFWFYLNEARPYMLQLAAGAVLLTGFLLLLNGRRQPASWVALIAGLVVLYYSTLLVFVTAGAFFLALTLLVWRKEMPLPARWFRGLAGVSLALLPGAIYYIETVLRGAGGARIWSVSPVNFAWVYYEVAGAVGLGPAVWQMRDIAREALAKGMSPAALIPLALPLLLCLLVAGVFAAGFRCASTRPGRLRDSFHLAFLFAFVLVSFSVLSVLLRKAFWARHLAPIFPVYALAFHYAALNLWQHVSPGVPWRRVLAGSCTLLLVVSSALLVFSPVHRKDDNRLAAQLALETMRGGGTVWWAASWHCGAYYGLPIVEGKSTSTNLQIFMGGTMSDLERLAKPGLVLISRPDIYDGSGSIRNYCQSRGYQPDGPQPHVFTAWKPSTQRDR